jgi:hypothetical protein
MLGVKTKEPIARPIPEAARTTARGRKAKPSSFSKRGAESVRSAWVEADVDDDGHSGASERRGKKESCKRQEEDSGEDGRYSIRKQQFSKTRRIVFTTDEEEGEIDEVITEYPRGDSSDEQEEVEEVACDLVVHKSGSRRRDRPVDGKAAERRDYWLSKAIALGQGESD